MHEITYIFDLATNSVNVLQGLYTNRGYPNELTVIAKHDNRPGRGLKLPATKLLPTKNDVLKVAVIYLCVKVLSYDTKTATEDQRVKGEKR